MNVSHWGFDGAERIGEIIVHADHATDVVSVFDALFMARFPIEQMRLVVVTTDLVDAGRVMS